MPVRIRAVAGAGTLRIPWAHRTVPLPTHTGEATTRSGSSRCISQHTAVMSATASMAPTSWKWMLVTGTPWTALSAAAICSYTDITSSLTIVGRGRAYTMELMASMELWVCPWAWSWLWS